MKAWFVWAGDPYFTWGDYVHGETPGKAKYMFMKTWRGETEWNDLRPHRCPELDNEPINRVTISAITEDNELWYPICECEICVDHE